MGAHFDLGLGEPITHDEIEHLERKALTDHLYATT